MEATDQLHCNTKITLERNVIFVVSEADVKENTPTHPVYLVQTAIDSISK